MTLQEQIHQEANNQIELIKSMYPYLRENELMFITYCLRSAYIKGALDALDNKKTNQ
jgi:hypothetical protein